MSEAWEPGAGDGGTPAVTPLRRRPRRRHSVYHAPISIGRVLLGGAFVAVLFAGGVYYRYTQTARYAIEVQGKVLVAMASRAEAEQVIWAVKRKHAPAAPEVVSFAEGPVTVGALHAPMQAMDGVQAVERLDGRLTAIVAGYAIAVNGKRYALLPTQAEASRAISLMLRRGQGDRDGVPTFKERVTVTTSPVQQPEDIAEPLPLLKAPAAADLLVHPPQKRIYTVQRGDNLWKIATEHGLTVQDVRTLNPNVNYQRMQPGDQIRLPDEAAPVTVVMRKIK